MVIMLGAAMSRLVTITCPHCGHKKRIERRPAAFRTCAKCHRRFDDPVTASRRKSRR